jgi:hypothetical protein
MAEAGDAIVGGDERHDRARAGGRHGRGRACGDGALVFAGLEIAAHLAEDAAGVGAEAAVTLDLRRGEQVPRPRDRPIDRRRAGDRPVRADRLAARGPLREPGHGVRPGVLVGPRILDRLPAAAVDLFRQQPRHLDRIRDDETAPVGGDHQVAGAGLAAAVDAVRPATGQPREVRLRGEQDAGEAAVAGEPGEAIGFLVEFCH